MDPNLEKIERLLDEALQQPPQERAAFLDSVCGSDETVRREVEALLAADGAAGAFLSDNPKAGALDASGTSLEGPGTVIGRYKLLEQIGEGGFGFVYMAEQLEPVKRRVALKIIKPGMDSKQVIGRFEAERQALALMDHPNIAQVFDAGATETGRPYFVMELVKGIPITLFCEDQQLDLEARLSLFIQVCSAVQHAHQKGIIHRDLKPSNILVTLHGDQPVPTVIDFGIAKATQQPLTDKTVFTQFQQFIGTPAYMSPEQATLSGLDVDTRSDIYSLGVLLYELLTGSPPFDTKELLSVGLDEMRRTIREKEPDRPSTRIRKTSQSGSQALPATRHSSLASDLDWIVMKALEKDRARRYETANGLAADLKRYLNLEPVVARPPSRLYEFQKTVRRHKVGFAATAAIIMVLLAGVLVSTWQTVRATRAKQEAVIEQQRANREAATANRVTAFMQQMLATANPDSSKSPNYTVREMLDDFAKTIDAQFADNPEVAAELHTTIGKAYWNMQEGPKAKAQLTRALELQATVHGTNRVEYAEALVNYAETPSINANTAELEECVVNLRRALAIYKEREITGYPVIHALWALQMVLDKEGKRNHIEELVTEAKAQARQTPGSNYWELAAMNIGLIDAKVDVGKYAEAEKIAYETIASNNRQFGTDYIQTAWVYYVLTYALVPQSKYEKALDAAKHAVAIMRKRISPDQIWYGTHLQAVLQVLTEARSARALTNLFSSAGQLEKLEPLFLDRLGSKPLSPDSGNDPVNVAMRAIPQFPGLYLELADELSAAGRTNAAAECRRNAAAFYEQLATRNSGDPDVLARLYLDSIQSLVQRGDWVEANKLREKLLALQHLNASSLNAVAWTLATSPYPELRNGPTAVIDAENAVATTGHTNVAYLDTLAAAYAEAGQFDQAVATEKEVIQLLPAGNANQYCAQCLSLYESSIPYRDSGALAENVLALLQAAKFAEAEPQARECLRLREKLIPDDWRTFNAQSMLGGSFLGQKKYAEAAPLLLSGYEGMIQREEQIPANVRQRRLKEALQRLAEFYQATGQTEKTTTEADTVLSDTNVASSTFLPREFLKRQLAQWSPENTLNSMRLAFALVWTGLTNEYELFCRKVLAYAADTTNSPAERAAKAYLVRGSDPELLKQAIALAEQGRAQVKDDGYRPWFQMCLGLACYRQKDYTGALETVAQSVTASNTLIKGPSLMIQAMARQQLGRLEDARASFQAGEPLMDPPPPEGELTVDVLTSHDSVFFWLLHAEAKALIDGSPPAHNANSDELR